MTAKKAFLDAVEDGVARCLIPVPSAPLMALGEALAAGAEAVESDTEFADDLEKLWDLYDAAENVSLAWNDFGHEQALVDPCAVQCLADAVRVEYLDHFGNDLAIVNAARVSMDKHHVEFDAESDTRLIAYLAREGHWTPFAHPQITLRITAPIFVARQLVKHQVGLVWSEISRRYVDSAPAFYNPPKWRGRAENVKQGSGGTMDDDLAGRANTVYQSAMTTAKYAYFELLHLGVSPEQARMILPLSMMTTWIWTGSLAAYARVCRLRLDSHAQAETRMIAEQINKIIAPLFPVAWPALMTVETQPIEEHTSVNH